MTLLNTDNYTFTSATALSGIGRFFLRIENRLLGNPDLETVDLKIFSSQYTIHINGQIIRDTKVSVYGLQGRLVMTSFLLAASEANLIDITYLSSGIYVVQLSKEQQNKTKKIIIN